MTRPADPKYETVLRETQRRVPLQATDADIVAYHRGMRAIDHRVDELTRIEGVLSRAMRKVKAKKVRLADERSRLGAASDRDVVERLVTCEVVYDARQGGAIFVRQKGETTVIAGSERPVSADERAVIAALEREPPGAEDEGLASKLRLMEYASDAPPDDIKSQVDEAIDASHLPPELQEALLALEEEDEEPEPKEKKAAKPKAEKPAKAPAEPKAKGKQGGKKKGAATTPAPEVPTKPAPAPAADGDAPPAEPGPAEMEPDEAPPRPPVAPPARAAESAAVSEEDATAEPPAAEDLADDASDADAAETGDSAAGGDVDEDGESEEPTEPADFVGDDQVDAEAAGAEGSPDAPPYPEAFDADEDEHEEPWEDGSAPPASAAAEGDDHVPEYEDLTVVRPGAEEPLPIDEEPAAAAPPPAPAPEPLPEPAPPPATPVAAPAPAATPEPPPPPAKAAARKKKGAGDAAPAPAPTNGAAAAQAAPAPVVTPAPALAASAPPAEARTAANHFGLSPAIAGKFGEAVVQYLGKEPMLASTAAATVSKKLGTLLTDNMRDALVPMLNHLAAEGKIRRQPAGSDMIFFIPEHAGNVETWFQKHQRANA